MVADQATLDVQGTVEKDLTVMTGGLLEGTGIIDGNLVVQGMLGPGNSAGTLGVDGSIDIDDDAMICVELGGLDAGLEYDTIDGMNSSTGQLGGLLEVTFIDNFMASQSDEFFIMSGFTTLNGVFANTPNNQLVVGNQQFDVEYSSTFVRLHNFQTFKTPESSSALMICVAGLLFSRRRRD
ncbi:MAG: hypothetical protein AAFN77_23460 [Planctomycetota bacterium]